LFTSCATPASSSPALASRSLSASRAHLRRIGLREQSGRERCDAHAVAVPDAHLEARLAAVHHPRHLFGEMRAILGEHEILEHAAHELYRL
jgi:hypothetical protein